MNAPKRPACVNKIVPILGAPTSVVVSLVTPWLPITGRVTMSTNVIYTKNVEVCASACASTSRAVIRANVPTAIVWPLTIALAKVNYLIDKKKIKTLTSSQHDIISN
jgi:hypothetical protein